MHMPEYTYTYACECIHMLIGLYIIMITHLPYFHICHIMCRKLESLDIAGHMLVEHVVRHLKLDTTSPLCLPHHFWSHWNAIWLTYIYTTFYNNRKLPFWTGKPSYTIYRIYVPVEYRGMLWAVFQMLHYRKLFQHGISQLFWTSSRPDPQNAAARTQQLEASSIKQQ